MSDPSEPPLELPVFHLSTTDGRLSHFFFIAPLAPSSTISSNPSFARRSPHFRQRLRKDVLAAPQGPLPRHHPRSPHRSSPLSSPPQRPRAMSRFERSRGGRNSQPLHSLKSRSHSSMASDFDGSHDRARGGKKGGRTKGATARDKSPEGRTDRPASKGKSLKTGGEDGKGKKSGERAGKLAHDDDVILEEGAAASKGTTRKRSKDDSRRSDADAAGVRPAKKPARKYSIDEPFEASEWLTNSYVKNKKPKDSSASTSPLSPVSSGSYSSRSAVKTSPSSAQPRRNSILAQSPASASTNSKKPAASPIARKKSNPHQNEIIADLLQPTPIIVSGGSSQRGPGVKPRTTQRKSDKVADTKPYRIPIPVASPPLRPRREQKVRNYCESSSEEEDVKAKRKKKKNEEDVYDETKEGRKRHTERGRDEEESKVGKGRGRDGKIAGVGKKSLNNDPDPTEERGRKRSRAASRSPARAAEPDAALPKAQFPETNSSQTKSPSTKRHVIPSPPRQQQLLELEHYDLGSESDSETPTTRCPQCQRKLRMPLASPVAEALAELPSRSAHNYSDALLHFCSVHVREEIIPVGKERGYPDVINSRDVKKRVLGMRRELISIVRGKTTSHFMQARKTREVENIFRKADAIKKRECGYYGKV
ncbi:hypothetical protein BDK51DRAFT_50031 [Blyttiomyces helicus]|uniref:Uncharacterized protein n=1 Tax=Blyttiomyces helicus TaxID=388810 RepID=A0A4V1IPK1_9FUNG|nr:hypothetical protein BDK51DRAFT_50031 [Blyttiomyces helicus]|eukprot:RKO83337.1 hypothetical protein BDK51DRAFT_50031 [Blyttiomyces helicus]